MRVSLAERCKFLIFDLESVNIPQRLVRVVFALHFKHLEAFPAKGPQLCDSACHVFIKVRSAHHGIKLELDAKMFTPVSNLEKLPHIITISSANLDVRGLVERVTGYGQDIKMPAVFLKPGFRDLAAIADNRHTFDFDRFFAEDDKVTFSACQQSSLELLLGRCWGYPPRNFGYRNGSPPAKLSFLIPELLSIARPRLASSNVARCEVLAVWKQKPHSLLHFLVKW